MGQASNGSVSVMVDSVNYMHERSVRYTLYDLSQSPPRAVGGAIVDRLATGGGKGCCISLPKTWHGGMKLRLDVEESDRTTIYPKQSRELEIPPYPTPGDLYVVFYPGPEHDVELVVSAAEPGHPDWRGRIKQTPWEQCVATYTRKPCFAALPKLFDTESSKGACTFMKDNSTVDADTLCLSAMLDCMRDFEDMRFCKDLLWGPYKR